MSRPDWFAADRELDAPPPDDARDRTGLWLLLLLAGAGGLLTGLVGGTFRLCLEAADRWRTRVLESVGAEPSLRWLLPVVGIAAIVAGARFLVRFVPQAAGSGVQRVEAQLRAEEPPARPAVLPVKFAGGLMSLGAGMALGREGPTVQMGASVGGALSRLTRLAPHDTRTITTALAGAGLGVAFSAPMGGALFVFEEVAHAFRTRLVVATLAAVGCGVAVSKLIIGRQPDFAVAALPAPGLPVLVAATVLGALCGGLGVLYNRLVVALLDVNDRLGRVPPEAKAAAVGAIVAVVGLLAPSAIGGGDVLTQATLGGQLTTVALLGIIAMRWVLGPLCYSAGTPGGLFAPLLLVGAALGALVANSGQAVLRLLGAGNSDGLSATALAVVGMSAFFTAVVRAPVTGVVLVAEMTATTSQLIPMALAGAAATVVCVLVQAPPIYDTLRLRMEQAEGMPTEGAR